MPFPTFYRSPSTVTAAALATANGALTFKRTVTEAGGVFSGRNDLGEYVFRGSRALAADIAAAGYDVKIHEGPPPDDALRANARWHAKDGRPTAWAAKRPAGGVAVEG